MTTIVLCGGSGTRLWPLSRKMMPKQFYKMFEGKSLFQNTLNRNCKITKSVLVVTNDEQYFIAKNQAEEAGYSEGVRYMIEAVAKNTAPAIALACASIPREDIVLVVPSDHAITDEIEYKQSVERAIILAENGNIVTFGIRPNFPETGYGYIEADGENVVSFKEKPDLQAAKSYLEAGNFLWNSGIFCFKAGVLLDELKKHSEEIYSATIDAYNASSCDDSTTVRIKYKEMSLIPEKSIDYAVLEKSNLVKVVECDIGWSDLGSFDALYENMNKDSDGNAFNGEVIALDSANNLVFSEERTVATVGVSDLVIVDTHDALLVAKAGRTQDVKKIVVQLQKNDSALHKHHMKVHRPWGSFCTLVEAENKYKIKRIIVEPGKSLSLQMHHHRNEHWVVVQGTAHVQVGENTSIVCPNKAIYIKMGEVHRLTNNGKIPLVIIEVQVGEYLGEDDIVRLEDVYGRV